MIGIIAGAAIATAVSYLVCLSLGPPGDSGPDDYFSP